VEDDVPVICGWSTGGLTGWLDYDESKPWEALAADHSQMS
jgi:hypothetical protein